MSAPVAAHAYGGYGTSVAFILVMFVLLVIIIRSGMLGYY